MNTIQEKEIRENAVYTYKEVQEIFGVKKTTLAKLIREEGLKPIVLGKSYRFLGEELLRFLRSKYE